MRLLRSATKFPQIHVLEQFIHGSISSRKSYICISRDQSFFIIFTTFLYAFNAIYVCTGPTTKPLLRNGACTILFERHLSTFQKSWDCCDNFRKISDTSSKTHFVCGSNSISDSAHTRFSLNYLWADISTNTDWLKTKNRNSLSKYSAHRKQNVAEIRKHSSRC